MTERGKTDSHLRGFPYRRVSRWLWDYNVYAEGSRIRTGPRRWRVFWRVRKIGGGRGEVWTPRFPRARWLYRPRLCGRDKSRRREASPAPRKRVPR